ncbi:ATPase [Rhodopseudomonas sp. AAP120]|uniref:F0F1 ATP synthase subunit B family protein n=1 Tax=Rhodopseudomonas TaxID=1073 RepID=UPI000164BDC4|nr:MULTISPECIES: H+transporting two-sector ATPase subunit B/B' [Rhodopseudomonas]ACE99605.1 H+transporting two-sector ATPase B/B' subunit [Rhodopseudomonas palustris TIE-1]KPF96163.1 ATPase [Rhodopseudomonas sp. AAP120]
MTIDWWTLGIQAINVIILVWLLARFFWRPVAAMIEQRRATARQIMIEAETKLGQATDALAEIERTRAGFEEERAAIIAAAHQAAEQGRISLLASAAQEAAALQASARSAIEKEKSATEQAWAERANRLAVAIAGRLVARLSGASVSSAFLDWLLREIRNLPDPVRSAVAANGIAIEAISATPIEPADQQRYRTLIGDAFGVRPQISFKVDPALIAGLELHGPHLVITNSWRADLANTLADLAHDDRSR